MESVFVKHGDEVKNYEAVGGRVPGRLLYAMAIISDVQPGVSLGAQEELDEVKELLQSVIGILRAPV